jgi:hypothetical protein
VLHFDVLILVTMERGRTKITASSVDQLPLSRESTTAQKHGRCLDVTSSKSRISHHATTGSRLHALAFVFHRVVDGGES